MSLLNDNHPESYGGMSDEELLERSINAPSLFALLVDRYQAPFLRKARDVIRDEEAALDIVQEAFVKIYRYAGKFEKQEGASFSSWAYKILLNVSFSHYQKRKRRGLTTAALSDELVAVLADKGAQAHGEKRELADYIGSVMKTLPEPFVRVLGRYFLEGRSQAEIAEEEGVTVGAIKTRMHRAKIAFRKAMIAREF
jgi:RNA polymerase sigma-70 factor (ECF subfamily)